MKGEETQFLPEDEEEKSKKEVESAPTSRIKPPPAESGRIIGGKPPGGGPKTGPGSRGGKGGGKGSRGAKGDPDKPDATKPKKARSAYNFYLLKRIAQFERLLALCSSGSLYYIRFSGGGARLHRGFGFTAGLPGGRVGIGRRKRVLKKEGVVEHHRDRFAQAAGEWRDMTFSERIPYEDMARADKDRHQKDLDIASRNLNAALLGSVPKHGQGMCSGVGFPGLKALAANSPHEDVCAVCKEEGDLLCCDFCPATHHLTCLDPPMLALPSDDVQWACPACSARVEVTEMTAPQQKPKRERKDGKKRQRASSATAGSPRGPGDAGTSLTIPKRKKEGQKRAKTQQGAQRGAVSKDGLEIQKSPREEGKPAQDAAAEGEGDGDSATMVKAPNQPRVSPRVGLGLTDTVAADMLAMRGGPDLGGSGHDRTHSKSMMSLAVAAASVAASEAAAAASAVTAAASAASAAAAAAAAAPPAPRAPPAPPKALGLKKLLHQRMQCDEASANPTSAFSPKKLLKHRVPKEEGRGFGYGCDERNEPSPRGDPAPMGGGSCEGGRFEGKDSGSAERRWRGGGDGGGGGGGGFTASASRDEEVGGRRFGAAAMFGDGGKVVAADGAAVNDRQTAADSGDYSRRYETGAGGVRDNGGVSGSSGGGDDGRSGSSGGFNNQGGVDGAENFGDARNRALDAGRGGETEVGADKGGGRSALNGMHVTSGVRRDPKKEAIDFSQSADGAEHGHGGGGDAGRWAGSGEGGRRDTSQRVNEHPVPSFGRRHPHGQELYNGDGDDHIGVNSARQQIGGTDGSDGPRKVSAHPNPVGVGQRSLHGRRHDYPHNGGPEVITHERSDPVPQTSVVGYNDAASFPPPPSWDGDRNWNSDGVGRDGRPGFGGGAETERERFARRSGGGMDGNESRKALANGAPPVYAGYGVSHGGSLARGAQSEAGMARRGEGQSSSSHSRQRSDGDGRRGVWAGASRDPSRLAGGRGRDVVDGGRRLGNQRLDGAREGTDGDRNDGIGERTGAGGGGGERIGRCGGGEIAGSGGARFHGWSERKRPLENIGAEDGTRGSPKKHGRRGHACRSWHGASIAGQQQVQHASSSSYAGIVTPPLPSRVRSLPSFLPSPTAPFAPVHVTARHNLYTAAQHAPTNPHETAAPSMSRSHSNRWIGETSTLSKALTSAPFDSRARPRDTATTTATATAMPLTKKSRNIDARDHREGTGGRQDEEEPSAGARRDKRGDAGEVRLGSDRSSPGRSREQATWSDRFRGDPAGSSRGSDAGREEVDSGTERVARGDGGELPRADRGHWKTRLASRDGVLSAAWGKTTRGSGGSRDANLTDWRTVESERRREDRAREGPASGAEGRDAGWQERTAGSVGKGEGSAYLGGRQGGRLDKPMRNDSAGREGSGGGRIRYQGERGRDVSGSGHPQGGYPAEGRGLSAGSGVGGDRRMRETNFRTASPALINGGVNGGGDRGSGGPPRPNRLLGGSDYSKFAAPRQAASSASSSSSTIGAAETATAGAGAGSATGYAALAAPAMTTSFSRFDRGRSLEREQGHRHQSMARSSTSSGGGGGGSGSGLPPFHPHGRSDSGSRGGRGFQGGGGSDDGYSRLGKSRPDWESGRQGGEATLARGARGRDAGPGGPKPWKEKGESVSKHGYGDIGSTSYKGVLRDGDKFGRRADSSNRYMPSGDRRGSFSGRMDGGGGRRGRGRGRGRGRFENRHNSNN
eukprot:jgi/Undpi1/11445/HiC_scaffold_30.g13742.m1